MSKAIRKNLFVTGRPGAGKTTLVRAVLAELPVEAGGFYTAEIRENGRRVGFSIADLRGPRGVLAHEDLDSPYRVGRYGVNREDLESIGVAALDAAAAGVPLIVMDEIGRMELCSPEFREAVRRALDSATPVLGTIQDRRNEFLDAVRARDDVEIVTVTESNRETAKVIVLSKVSAVLGV